MQNAAHEEEISWRFFARLSSQPEADKTTTEWCEEKSRKIISYSSAISVRRKTQHSSVNFSCENNPISCRHRRMMKNNTGCHVSPKKQTLGVLYVFFFNYENGKKAEENIMNLAYKAKRMSRNGSWVETGAFPRRVGGDKFPIIMSIQCLITPKMNVKNNFGKKANTKQCKIKQQKF